MISDNEIAASGFLEWSDPRDDATDPPASKVVLNVGCGHAGPGGLHSYFQNEEWREIRLDVDPDAHPDVVASMTDMRAITSESVEAVWSSHNLEHLHHHEIAIALGEFMRVLRPGGLLLLTLPDLQQIAELVARDQLDTAAYVAQVGAITARDMIYGHTASLAAGYGFMAHKTGFTASTLRKALADAGFAEIQLQRGRRFDLWARASKPR